jgi:hypothetical protein
VTRSGASSAHGPPMSLELTGTGHSALHSRGARRYEQGAAPHTSSTQSGAVMSRPSDPPAARRSRDHPLPSGTGPDAQRPRCLCSSAARQYNGGWRQAERSLCSVWRMEPLQPGGTNPWSSSAQLPISGALGPLTGVTGLRSGSGCTGGFGSEAQTRKSEAPSRLGCRRASVSACASQVHPRCSGGLVELPPVAERLRRAYPALLERAGVGSIPANSDAQKRAFFPPSAI